MRGSKLLTTCVIVLTACGGVSEADRNALSEKVSAAEQSVATLEAARRDGLVAFMASPTTVPAQCPAGVWIDADPFDSRGSRGLRHSNFTVVEQAALGESEGARAGLAGPILSTIRTSLDPDGMIPVTSETLPTKLEHAEQMATPAWHPTEVTFVLTRSQAPRITGPQTFSPGFIAGTVVVWSYESGSVVCAFPHRTESRARAEVHHGQESSLVSALRGTAQNEVRTRLGGGGS